MEQEIKEKKQEIEKKKKSKLRKTLEWVFTGIFGVMIVCLGVINIARWTNKDGFIFSYLFPVVLSESMEPDYKIEEVIIVKKVDVDTLKVGDDITFYYSFNNLNDGKPVMCTHRIIEINKSEEEPYKYDFVAQGINKDSEKWNNVKQYFHEDAILGKVVGKSAFIGFIYKAFSSVWTLLLLILLPSLYLVITSIIDLFKKIPDDEPPLITDKGEIIDVKEVPSSSKSRLSEMSNEDKERLKKELLQEMLNKRKEGK